MATPKKLNLMPHELVQLRSTALDLAVKDSGGSDPERVTTRAAEYLRFLTSGTKPAPRKPVEHKPLQLKDDVGAA